MNTKKMPTWFEVDKEGLRNQARERGSANVLIELISNSLDERDAGVTAITIHAIPVPSKPLVEIRVEDNSPTGYGCYLHHAYTLFAPSHKRSNAEQSGQFNFGCKLFLSLCQNATISTVTGTVAFDDNGKRTVSRRRQRATGTVVEGTMLMTRSEFEGLSELMKRLLVPNDVVVTFNDTLIEARSPIRSFTANLTTKVADEDGVMRAVRRMTSVDIYEPCEGTTPMLYEMAVPVVETDIPYDIRIGQKVLLSKDRDNVTPAYLREIKRVVADKMSDMIDVEDAAGWCNDVLADGSASHDACQAIIRSRFGDNAAIFDPSDQEANVRWQTEHDGTLVTGRMLKKEQWKNVRRHNLLQATGVLIPTAKAYSDDPNAPKATHYTEEELTPGMKMARERAYELARAIDITDLEVVFVKKGMDAGVRACYKTNILLEARAIHFNVSVVGEEWFRAENTVAIVAVIIHELAHQFIGSHTHSEPHVLIPGGHFYDACCYVAARALSMLGRNTDENGDVRTGKLKGLT